MHTNQATSEPVVVEAIDLEAALAEVARRLGPNAEIVEANRIHRGGIGGFFAKEMVQVVARPAGGHEAVLSEMVAAADEADDVFRRLLLERLEPPEVPDPPEPSGTADEPIAAVGPMATTLSTDTENAAGGVTIDGADPGPSTVGAPASDVAETLPAETTSPVGEAAPRVEDDPAPPGLGRVDWSTTALARIGLPAEIVDATAELDPADDLAWIERIAAAVAPLCGPLPSVSTIVVGAQADRLAAPLDLPLVSPPEMPPYSGSVCSVVTERPRDLEWLAFVKGDRRLHLVVGDEPWRALLVEDPVVVSWSGDRGIVDAVYLATTLGATLGFGTVDGFASAMVRARPVDVALAIRRLVGRV
ncbi:MAG TPA: hypothetical protein ENK55_08735 [Actinobacteria bacterium]|nr:hypothetical protein [Actinomycetota bacterium]